MKAMVATAVSVLTILAGTLAYAQVNSSPVLAKVEVKFGFMAGKTMLPAGKYEIVKQAGNEYSLLLRGVGHPATVRLMVLERLAETKPTEKHGARIVFNTVGDQTFISEFWPADNDDGYLLSTTKRAHRREILEAMR